MSTVKKLVVTDIKKLVLTETRDCLVEAINAIEKDDPEAFAIVWRKGKRMEYRNAPGMSVSEFVGMVERAKFIFQHDEEHV